MMQSVIYFLRGDRSGLIKIGSTTNLKQRIRRLQTGAPEKLSVVAVMDGDGAAERELHQRFSDARAVGEWFHPRPDLLRLIERLARTPASHPALSRISARSAVRGAEAMRDRTEPIRLAADLHGLTERDWFVKFVLPTAAEIARKQIAEVSPSDPVATIDLPAASRG